MFKRFTEDARSCVVSAQEEALRVGHNYLGKEHLLMALASSAGTAGEILRDLGVTHDRVEREVVRIVGRGAPRLGPDDADALRAIGIDLDEVRRRVESVFGRGALDRSPAACGMPFTPRAKQALELALREAEALGDSSIRTEHLLLGVLRSQGGAGAAVAVALGLDLRAIRRLVIDRQDRAS